MKKNLDVSGLRTKISSVLASANSLFQIPLDSVRRVKEIEQREFIELFITTLKQVDSDLIALDNDSETASRKREIIGEEPDAIDYMNALTEASGRIPFKDLLENTIVDLLTFEHQLEALENLDLQADNKTLLFQIRHADRFCRLGPECFTEYLNSLDVLDGKRRGLPRLNPQFKDLNLASRVFMLKNQKLAKNVIGMLREKAIIRDPFHADQAFRFLDKRFYPANLSSIRSTDKFYGYNGARRLFEEFFKNFSEGKSNLPLLISSLPGLGKTHFSISYASQFENLKLILPESDDLEKPLEKLIRELSRRKAHRFVIFFDDVDTRKINWYYFRTHVGGSFTLPDNITIVIASNYEFPANISSRGRGYTFPIFDDITCQEMIRDYLLTYHMKKPPNELISVIAANYVEEFGQKKFEELSPRTLVRYLERYDRDMNKRKRMLDLSREEIIQRPDSQCFFEMNAKLVKALYGEEAIEGLRQELLSG